MAYHRRYDADSAGNKAQTVLDLGCGFGQLLPDLTHYFSEIYAVDPDPAMTALSRLLVSLDGDHLEHLKLKPLCQEDSA